MSFIQKPGSNRHVWETISVEVEGPFEKSAAGNCYIVILTDLYSKWIEAKAISECTSENIASFILSTFTRMGFCDCKFFNMASDFEKEVREVIHTLGSPFVENVEKFKNVLNEILAGCTLKDNETQSNVRMHGFHTEVITSWMAENPDTWDLNLEGFLFKLRMGDPGSSDSSTISPFSLVYGRMNSDNNGSKSDGESVKRGRGRPPGKAKRWSRWSTTSSNTNLKTPVEGLISSAENPTGKRRPGRPRKIISSKEEANDESNENDGESESKRTKLDSSEDGLKVENVISDKKYGLRTRLKPKVKTSIVKRMLKLSAHKRSNRDSSFCPDDFAFEDDQPKFKRKPKKQFSSDDKFIVTATTELDNLEKHYELGEASITDEAGEVTVFKLVSNVFPSFDEQQAAALSIQPHAEEGETEFEDKDMNDYLEDEIDEDDDDDDEIDDLEDEDDIEDDDDDDDDENDSKAASGETESDAREESLRVPCTYCPGLYLGEKESQLHAQFHKDGSKLLHCLYCTDVTSTWEHMQNHLLAHIDKDNAPGAATMLKKLKASRAAALSCRRLRRKELAGTTSIRCPFCPNVRMATKTEEEVHQSCHREDSRLLRCPHCDHVSGSWLQMQAHLAMHPEVPPESYTVPIEERTCTKCYRVFPTSEMVVEHQNIFHAEQRKFQCEECGKIFKERKSMARHKEIHANILYRCGDCTYKTKIHQDLVDHQRIHQGLGFKCDLCDKVFARQTQLQNHKEVHNKDQTVIVCDQCGRQLHGMTALRNHRKEVHGVQQSFPCSLCSYVGKTKSNLKGHTDRIHNKQFKCSHCEFACLAERTLVRHIDMFHNEDRKFRCKFCPYRAKDPKCLTEHVRVLHNPDAPKIPCEFCNMEFKTKSMLRDHLPQHTGQRFVCKLCGYIAKYRSILYRHVMKRHPGHTLAMVTETTDLVFKQTPTGKPIIPSKPRGSRKSAQPALNNIEDKLLPVATTCIKSVISSEDVTSDPESQTTTLIVASDNEQLDPESGLLRERELTAGGMYIATMADGETLTLNEDGIVVDENTSSFVVDASLLGPDGSITLNNMRLQLIPSNIDGDLTMQVLQSDTANEGVEYYVALKD